MNKLNECKPGDKFIIKYLNGTDEQKRHLQNLGFVQATIVEVINVINENMIVQIFDSRVAINYEVSNNVYGTMLKRKIVKSKGLSLFKKR